MGVIYLVKNANSIYKEISDQWKIDLPKIKNLKFHYLDDDVIIITGIGLKVIKTGDAYLPFLTDTEILKKFPYVMVDMGAVKFLANGADVMAPGIIKFEGNFKKGDIVVVQDEQHQKPIAITSALYSVEESKRRQHGKILKNIHYVGDRLWNTLKQLKR